MVFLPLASEDEVRRLRLQASLDKKEPPARPALPVMLGAITERQFQAQVEGLARLLGWTTYHPWLSLHSRGGYPDLTMVRPPRVILAEVKTERGKLTAEQQEWHDLLKACPGVEAYIWRPSDFEAIEEVLKR